MFHFISNIENAHILYATSFRVSFVKIEMLKPLIIYSLHVLNMHYFAMPFYIKSK